MRTMNKKKPAVVDLTPSRDVITLTEIHKARLAPMLALIESKKADMAGKMLEALGIAGEIGKLGAQTEGLVLDIARLNQIDPADPACPWEFDPTEIRFRRKKPADANA